MAAGLYNMILEQGASLVRTVTWTDENGSNPDLSTGYTASMVISDSWGSTALLSLTHSSGLTLAAAGLITITITPAQSAALAAQEAVYHLEVHHTSSDKKDRLLKGTFKIEPKAGA